MAPKIISYRKKKKKKKGSYQCFLPCFVIEVSAYIETDFYSFFYFSAILYKACWWQLSVPGGTSGKEPACQCRRHKRRWFDPWVRKISWRRKQQPTPVFLPGKSHGQRSLLGYSSWGWKELDTTEHTCMHMCARAHTHTDTHIHTHTPVQGCGIKNTHTEITQLFIPFFTLCKSSCTGLRDQGSCPSLYSQSFGHEKDSVSQSNTWEKGRLWLAQDRISRPNDHQERCVELQKKGS